MSGPPKTDVNITMVTLVGLWGTIFLFSIILATQAWYYNVQKAELQTKVIERSYPPLEEYVARETTQLNSYRWIDPKTRKLAIPIEDAIAKTAEELRSE